MGHKKSSTRQVRLDLVSPFLYTGPGAGTNTSGIYDDFGLQGIKGGDSQGSYLITGTSGTNGVIYSGPIDHAMSTSGSGSGSWTVMNVPAGFNASSSSIYGVDNLGGNNVDLVGSYVSATADSDGQFPRIGFYYNGPITDRPRAEDYLSYQGRDPVTGKLATFTYIHSISGGLAVGNYDFLGDGNPAGNAFIYDPDSSTPQTAVDYGGDGKTHTAYGIWFNGGSDYTIAGGEGLNGSGDGQYGQPLGKGTLIDYDSVTGEFSNYRTYSFTKTKELPKAMRRQSIVTHFEGIWSNGEGTYKLPATIATADGALTAAALATVKRNRDGSFGKARWSLFDIPGAPITTNDSVFGDANVGVSIYSQGGGASNYAGLVL
jgi:hypothetical protein